MEKVKVSKKIAFHLDAMINDFEKEEILKKHMQGWYIRKELNYFTFEEMVAALYVGYEEDLTPEELLFEKFNKNKEMLKNNIEMEEVLKYENINKGIFVALNTLGIKIKGINKGE